MRRRFLLVHNPTAGLIGSTLLEKVISVLERDGATVTRAALQETVATAASLSLATEGYDAVIAAGGDGTIRALSIAGVASKLPIGIVPSGTGNVFATEISLPRTARAIAEVLVSGPVVDIEGARANGKAFFLMAGAGFCGEVTRRLDTGLKRRLGKPAYVGPVMRALMAKPVELEVTVDGARHRARWVVAANARHYGGSFIIARHADLLKPGLQVVLFKSLSRLTSVRQLLALGLGNLERDRDVEILPCRRLTVEAAAPVPAEVDGDLFEPTPLLVEAGGAHLQVIVPLEFAKSRSAIAV
jgi:YegS/Rv2252/BmrU family lipid kinase